MDNENETDLFEIRVNETSKKFVRKVYPLVSISFIVNILWAILIIGLSVSSFINYFSLKLSGGNIYFFIITPVFSIVHSIIAILGGYYYFLFIKKMKQGINNSDGEAYNLAFKYVY